jgi:hypothetical protein
MTLPDRGDADEGGSSIGAGTPASESEAAVSTARPPHAARGSESADQRRKRRTSIAAIRSTPRAARPPRKNARLRARPSTPRGCSEVNFDARACVVERGDAHPAPRVRLPRWLRIESAARRSACAACIGVHARLASERRLARGSGRAHAIRIDLRTDGTGVLRAAVGRESAEGRCDLRRSDRYRPGSRCRPRHRAPATALP